MDTKIMDLSYIGIQIQGGLTVPIFCTVPEASAERMAGKSPSWLRVFPWTTSRVTWCLCLVRSPIPRKDNENNGREQAEVCSAMLNDALNFHELLIYN